MDCIGYGMALNWSTVGLGVHSAPDSLVFALYLLLVLSVGLWAILTSNRGTVTDFFLAGQNLAWWLVGLSLFSANTGSGHLIGLAGIGASSGIAIGVLEWNAAVLLFTLGWIFAPIYLKAEVVTVSEYFRKRFGTCRIEIFFSVLCLFLYIFNRISLEVCSYAMFMRMVWGMDIYLIILVLLIVAGFYTITGGLTAVVYTSVLHVGIMLLGSVLLMVYAFNEVGGFEGLLEKYVQAIPSTISEGNWTAKPECYFPRPDAFHIIRDPTTGDFPWPGLLFGLSILSLYNWCADQIFVQRCLAGRNMSNVKGGCLLCGYLKLLPLFYIVMPGMISRILYPDKVACIVPSECQKHCGTKTGCSPIAYPMLVIELLPTGLRGLLLSSFCASFMSSLTSVFNGASALFTLNIYTTMRPMATEKELMVTGRFFVIILLVVTIACVPIMQWTQSEKFFKYTLAVRSYVEPPMAAVFLLAMFCKRVNEQGAFWGLIFGITIGFIRLVAELVYSPWSCMEKNKCPAVICGLHYLHFAMVLFLISLVSMLGISLLTAPIPEKHLYRLCWSLRNSQEERIDLDTEKQVNRLPRGLSEPDILKETQSCPWKTWDLFCGLKPQPSPKLAPATETTESRKWRDTSERPFGKCFVNICAIVLLMFVILSHIYYI
uniref:Sodium/glucose cotransporter 2 n=1 Tax=Otolemur garnettii TaxID=30611 RepID=H0XY46_OTOGA